MKRTLLMIAMVAAVGSASAQALRDDRSYQLSPAFVKGNLKHQSLRENRSDWFDPCGAIDQLNSQTTYFRSTLFPDSSVLVQYSNGLGEVGWHSAGIIMDPRSLIYESNPFKLSRWNTYTVDSIAVLYMYTRWNPNVNIKDTLRITTFTGSTDVLIYQNTALGTVAYNRPNNRIQGTTTQTHTKELTIQDTIASRFAFYEFAAGRTVTGGNSGGNWTGVGISYVPGDKTYSKAAPFDTLDCRSNPNVVRRFNQFEFQLVQDQSAYVESNSTDAFGQRILNNGFMVNTQIRYALYTGQASQLNNSYYGGTWTNSQQQSFTYAPRVLFKLSTNNYSNDELTRTGVSVGMPYPNPATNGKDIAIDFKLRNAANAVVTLNDMNGRQVQTIANSMFRNGENTVSFKPQGLKAGMYLVTVRTAEGFSTGKVVIE
jgi:hypothetical protein